MTRAAAAVLGVLAAGALRCGHGGREGEGPVVWELRLAGVRAVDEDDLREKLATRQRGPLERLLLGTPLLYSGEEPRLDRDALQVDRRRIEAYYRQRGHYATSVGEEEVLPLDPDRVRVVLRVEEGPAVIVTAVEVVGLAEEPEADARLRDLPLRAGAVFTEAARGGHTLARHVGLSDDDLRERLRREPRISAASTWADRRVAEQVVGEALARSADRVRSWTRPTGSRPNLPLDYRGSSPRVLGRSLRRGRSRVETCIDAVVVLKWRESDRDFFVLTAYPEVRR